MPTTVSLPLNHTCKITVSPLDAAGDVVPIPAPPTWTSGTPATATVTPIPTLSTHIFEAIVNPLIAGTTIVTVTAGTVSDTINVTVVAAAVVTPTAFSIRTSVQ